MKIKDLLKLSTRMFRARSGRTALTILGMGIGFGAILFLVSLGYGLQNALLGTITSTGALVSLDVSPNEQEGKTLTPDVAGELEKIQGVKQVEPSYDLEAQLRYGDTVTDARSIIASPGFLDLDGIKVSAGKVLNKNDSKEVLISSAFEKILEKKPEELVGQKITFTLTLPSEENLNQTRNANQATLKSLDYTVIGITENEEAVFYVPSGSLDIPETIPYAKIKVECQSSSAITSVKDAITQKGFLVSSLSETIAEVNKLFGIINIVLGLFGIVTLSVSAIGMFNTMTVALMERTKEIGIMRSIGASKADIRRMFVIESTLMGLCGGVAGLILGIASGQIVNFAINMAAKYFGGKTLSLFSYPFWFLGFILLFSIVIGFATGVGPARRASVLDPLEALRTR